MSAVPFVFGTPHMGLTQLSTATGTTPQTIAAGGASGSKITSIGVVSESSAVAVLQLSILRAAVNYSLGATSIPANSGSDGATAAVDLLGSTLLPYLAVDNDGQKYLFLESGDTLQAKTTAAIPAGRLIHINSCRGDG